MAVCLLRSAGKSGSLFQVKVKKGGNDNKNYNLKVIGEN
jgi:hypothetical protein